MPWMLRDACLHQSGCFITLRRSCTLLPFRATSALALPVSPGRADSMRLAYQVMLRASRPVSLPLSVWWSTGVPRLILWLIQPACWLLHP